MPRRGGRHTAGEDEAQTGGSSRTAAFRPPRTIAEREDLVARSARVTRPDKQDADSDEAPPIRPENTPQGLPKKIESVPGNGMGPKNLDPQYLVHGRVADRARLRLTSRETDKVA